MRVLVNTMHIVIAALFVTPRWERVGFISGHAPWVMRMKRSFMSRGRLCFGLVI
jgi:hypothetical protein